MLPVARQDVGQQGKIVRASNPRPNGVLYVQSFLRLSEAVRALPLSHKRPPVEHQSHRPEMDKSLRMGERHIRRMERRAKADGSVTRGERRRLNHAQNRESRRIYRLKHNGRTA